MPSVMTRRAERNAIGGIVAQPRVFRPRPQMMGVELPARLFAAILARPTIAFHDRRSELLIERVRVIRAARRPRAAFPVWMRGANQMIVSRRLNASFAQSDSDLGAVLRRQAFSAQGSGDVGALCIRQNAARCRRLPLSCCGDPSPSLGAFGGIVSEVSGDRPTGARTELRAASNVVASALSAGSSVSLRHVSEITGKAA